MKWINEEKHKEIKLGLLDPELKISDDAKKFIHGIIDRIEAILKKTIFYKGESNG